MLWRQAVTSSYFHCPVLVSLVPAARKAERNSFGKFLSADRRECLVCALGFCLFVMVIRIFSLLRQVQQLVRQLLHLPIQSLVAFTSKGTRHLRVWATAGECYPCRRRELCSSA